MTVSESSPRPPRAVAPPAESPPRPPPPERRPTAIRIAQAQREQTRAALVRAALGLFQRQGFEATTVEAVAAAAGVAKGTFYNYFATKEDVALAAIVPVLEQARADLALAPGDRLSAQLDRLLGVLGGWSASSPELIWVWATELMRRGVDQPGSAIFHELLTGIFAAAQRGGQVRADRSPEHLALGLEGILLAHVAHWHHGGARAALAPLLREAADTYLGGAAAPTDKEA